MVFTELNAVPGATVLALALVACADSDRESASADRGSSPTPDDSTTDSTPDTVPDSGGETATDSGVDTQVVVGAGAVKYLPSTDYAYAGYYCDADSAGSGAGPILLVGVPSTENASDKPEAAMYALSSP